MHSDIPMVLIALMIPNLNLFRRLCVQSVSITFYSNSFKFYICKSLISSLNADGYGLLLTMQKMLCSITLDFKEGWRFGSLMGSRKLLRGSPLDYYGWGGGMILSCSWSLDKSSSFVLVRINSADIYYYLWIDLFLSKTVQPLWLQSTHLIS